jgi:anti-sigma factor RsiW
MHGVNCPDFRDRLIEAARGTRVEEGRRRELAAHLNICSECAREFEEQLALSDALRAMARETKSAPDILQARLLVEFDAARTAQRRRVILRWLPIAAALAVAAFLTGRLLMDAGRTEARPVTVHVQAPAPASVFAPASSAAHRTAPTHPVRLPRRGRPVVTAESRDPQEAFFAIPYTLPLAPGERTEIVRMDMPVAAMIAAGWPLDVADSGARAQADVLLGEDGRARAIHLVSISDLE